MIDMMLVEHSLDYSIMGALWEEKKSIVISLYKRRLDLNYHVVTIR